MRGAVGVAALPPEDPVQVQEVGPPGSSKATLCPRSPPRRQHPGTEPVPPLHTAGRPVRGSNVWVLSRTLASAVPRVAQQRWAGTEPQVRGPENPSLDRWSSPEKSPGWGQVWTPGDTSLASARLPQREPPDNSEGLPRKAGGADVPDTQGQTHTRRADTQDGQRRGSAEDRALSRIHTGDQDWGKS